MTGYRNISGDKPKWYPVELPTPQFDSVAETKAWQRATTENPRTPGEDICDWAKRVETAAKEILSPRMPYAEREPGEDG